MNVNIITKESTNNEIKTYFEKVLEVKNLGEEFPVNLDEVWALVYDRKDVAVRALKSDFMQGIDYQVFPKNVENPKGGRPTEDYFLSVSCMEYFIARKVRPVFEVYRQIFHKVAEQKQLSGLDYLQQQLNMMKEHDVRLFAIENKVNTLEARTKTRPDYFSIVAYGALNHIPVNLEKAKKLGKQAATLCKKTECADG